MTNELLEAPTEELTEGQKRESFLLSLDDGFPALPDQEEYDRAQLDVYLDHLLEKLGEREQEIRLNAEVAQRRIANVQAWLKAENQRHEKEAEWLRQQIESFARDYDYGRKKSRDLPHGVFGTRAKAPTLEIVDKQAALTFAKVNELEIVESVNKTPLKKYFETTGEIPDGTEYVPGGETFYVKPAGV